MGIGSEKQAFWARGMAILASLALTSCCFNNSGPGCAFNDSSSSDAVKAGGATDPNASAMFSPAQRVIRNQCIQCHVSFGSYTEAEWLSSGYLTAGDPNTSPVYARLRGAGVGGTENMPPGGALSAPDRNTIKNWISGLTTQTTTGAAARLAAAFTVLGKRYPLTNESCLTCHSTQRTATSGTYGGANVPIFGSFSRDNDFVTSGLVVPGSPSISWLYRALRTHGDIGTMPKGESTSMTPGDAAILSDWITNIGNP